MAYLEAAEYENYGLPSATSADWITAASALINSYCRRGDLNVAQYSERLRVTGGANTVRLSYLPLAILGTATSPLISMQGRYAPMRRGEYAVNALTEAAMAFSLPGSWNAVDVSSVDYDLNSGELTLSRSFYGMQYSEVSVAYTAGLATIGDDIKAACAQIVRNAQAMPALNVQKGRVDTLQMEYFSGNLLDPTVQAWLRPYVASRLG